MADVDCCVVGAGFAGLTAALRLKQGGHWVAHVRMGRRAIRSAERAAAEVMDREHVIIT